MCAFSGMAHILRKERNMKVHFAVALFVVVLSMMLNIEIDSMLWIFLAIALVLITEVLNTFFEELLNFISPKYHVAIKHMKDLAAGGVLTAAVFAVVVALIIFGKKAGTNQVVLADIVFLVYLGTIAIISIWGGEKKNGSKKNKSGDR